MKPLHVALNTNCLRRTHTPAEIAALARRVGLDGIEWGLPPVDEAAAAAREMAQVTADAGLQVAAFINAGHLWKTDLIRRTCDAIAPAGGRMLRVAHPWLAMFYGESLHQRDSYMDLFRKARAGLEALLPLSRETGIRFVLETHAGSVCASPVAARWLLDGLDPQAVGILYDPANTLMEGYIRPREAAEVMGPYLAYLHVKNLVTFHAADLVDGPWRRLQRGCRNVPLDAGELDYLEVLFGLKCVGFDGWYSFEEFFAEDAENRLRAALATLRAVAEAAPDAPQPPFTTFNA